MDRLTKSIGLVLVASAVGVYACSSDQEDGGSFEQQSRSSGSGSHFYVGSHGGSYGGYYGGSHTSWFGRALGSIRGGFGGSARGGGS